MNIPIIQNSNLFDLLIFGGFLIIHGVYNRIGKPAKQHWKVDEGIEGLQCGPSQSLRRLILSKFSKNRFFLRQNVA